MSISTTLPDFKSRALAALNVGQAVHTAKGCAFHESKTLYCEARFVVSQTNGKTTFHASAALAVAFLASL